MPACTYCGVPAVVQWVRRPNGPELSTEVARVKERHAKHVELSDPQLPPPSAPVLPTAADTTMAIYACGDHAITASAASLIHASTCSAPNPTNLPACDCVQEQHPSPPIPPQGKKSKLPPDWQQ